WPWAPAPWRCWPCRGAGAGSPGSAGPDSRPVATLVEWRAIMRLSLLILVALAALWPGAARAEMVPFSYSWSFGDVQLAAQGPGPIHLSASVSSDRSTLTVNYGGAMAVLTVAPAGSASAPTGAQGAGIPAASFRLISLPGGPGGDFSFT